jgi:hypothetical protein
MIRALGRDASCLVLTPSFRIPHKTLPGATALQSSNDRLTCEARMNLHLKAYRCTKLKFLIFIGTVI